MSDQQLVGRVGVAVVLNLPLRLRSSLLLLHLLLLPTVGWKQAFGQVGGPGFDAGQASALLWNSLDGRATSVSLVDGSGFAPDLPRFQLRPLQLTSRDGVDRFRSDLPQTEVVHSTPTIGLVDGRRLVHFASTSRGSAGFALLGGKGREEVLLDLPLIAGKSPFAQFAAVSPFEPVAAVVTDENRVGRADVYLVRLDGRSYLRSGQPWLKVTGSLPNSDADPTSLAFSRSALWFVDDSLLLYRVPSDGSTDALEIALPLSGGRKPLEVSEEIAVSGDGSTIALLGGQSEDVWDIYVGLDDGTIWNLTQNPSQYQEIGHYPTLTNGPLLALSVNGATLTYADENPDLELFHRRVDGSDAPLPLTTDQWFEQSLDEGSSIITALSAVIVAFGEDPSAKDVYRIDLGSGSVQSVQNLTNTSGDGNGAPWETGAQLTPTEVGRADGGESLWLLDDLNEGVGTPVYDLWTTDGRRTRRQLQGLVEVPSFVPSRPSWNAESGGLLLWNDGTQYSVGRLPQRAHRPLELLLSAPIGVRLNSLAVREDGRDFAVVAELGPGLATVAAFDMSTLLPRLFMPRLGWAGEDLAYTRDGRLLFSFGMTPDRGAFLEDAPGSSTASMVEVEPGDLWILR